MPNKNSNSDLLTPDERALYIRQSIQGIQRIIGECFAKYEEDGNLVDFSMQYRGPFNNVEFALPSHTQLKQQMTIHIRSDYGHGVSYSHFDVQLFDNGGSKLYDKDVPQDENFPSYESAINAVFMQVEKLSDPLIGAKYWLSPAEISLERVSILSDLRKKYNILTSLSVVCRIINLRTLEATRRGPTDELSFWKITDSVLQSCKEQETQLGGPLNVEVQYNTNMSMLPFFFFQHCVLFYYFQRIR